jgi:hypothetical protein
MDVGLLIDFEHIIKPRKLIRLQNKIFPIPDGYANSVRGLILIIPKNDYTTLKQLKNGDDRVQYINSQEFIDNISGHAYVLYNKHKLVCELICTDCSLLPIVVQSTLMSIPNDVTLFVSTKLHDPNIDKLIQQYVKLDFNEVYISEKSPIGYTVKEPRLYMTRKNDVIESSNVDTSINNTKYIVKQLKSLQNDNSCKLHVKLSEKAINYLQSVSMIGSTMNRDGAITQKEIAGRLVVGNIGDDLTHYLDVDRSSIVHGNEEEVQIIDGLYNFHSHPVEAYDRHNKKYGWPSSQDYIGFFGASISYDTILHIVSSIEGFYVISLGSFWAKNKDILKTKNIKFILEECNIDVETPTLYLKEVNKVSMDGHQLFNVQFFSWDDADSLVAVNYTNNDLNCFTSKETLSKYKVL